MTGKNTAQNIVIYSLLWLSEMPATSRIADAPEGMFTESMSVLESHGLAAVYDGVWCLTTKGEDNLAKVSDEDKRRFRMARQLAEIVMTGLDYADEDS